MLHLDQLLHLQTPRWLRLSPSGEHVIYTTSTLTSDKPLSTLWLASLANQKSSRRFTSGLFNDTSPQWCPDQGQNQIAFVSDRANPGKSSAIYCISTTGGEPYPITPPHNTQNISAFRWSPDGNFIAYLSADEKSPERKAKEETKDDPIVYGQHWEYARLRLLHLSTQSITTLVSLPYHVVDLCWNEHASELAFTTQPTPEFESGLADGMALHRISIATKHMTTLSNLKHGIKAWSEEQSLCWLSDIIYFIAGTDPEHMLGSTSVHCISATCTSGNVERVAGGESDCASGIYNAGGIFTHFMRGMYDEIRTMDGFVVYSEPAEFTHWHAISPPDSATHSNPTIALVKGATNKPSEVYALVNDNLVQLSDHGATIHDTSLGDPIFLSVPSADGRVALDGLYITPKTTASSPSSPSSPSKPHPTLVIIHGGPYNRITDSFAPEYGWGTYLLSLGYGILYPNYRGGSSHGEGFASYARGRIGVEDYEDIITLTNHCIAEGLIDKERVIVSGWSAGGFLSYLAAVRNGTHNLGWLFRGAICGAGISDLDFMLISSDVVALQGEMAGQLPWLTESKSDVHNRRGSALWEIAAAAKEKRIPPVLILHGELDIRVPIGQARAFMHGCRHWGVPVDMVVYPRAGHVVSESNHVRDMFERVKNFCHVHTT